MKIILVTLLFIPIFVRAQTLSTPSVDLIWEAETYAPPWYQGRTLPSPESLVRVVALTKISQPIFHWRKDGTDVRSASGAGKNSFDYRVGAGGSSNLIEVAVTRLDGSVAAAGAARIPVVAPKILFYELKDGWPDYRRALKNLAITADQTKIIAEPFYFSLADPPTGEAGWLNRRLVFDWSANSQPIAPATEDPRFLTLLTTAETSGESLIDLKITNADRSRQVASAKLPVSFGQSGFGF